MAEIRSFLRTVGGSWRSRGSMVCSLVGSFGWGAAGAASPASSVAGLRAVMFSIVTSRIEDIFSFKRGEGEVEIYFEWKARCSRQHFLACIRRYVFVLAR